MPCGAEARPRAELDATAAEHLGRVVAEAERTAVEPGEVRRLGHAVVDVGKVLRQQRGEEVPVGVELARRRRAATRRQRSTPPPSPATAIRLGAPK